MSLDSVANFIKLPLASGFNSSATSITFVTGDGAKLPTPPANLVVYNSTDYSDPTDDPLVEVVRYTTAPVSDVLTIIRAQEGTTAQNHNIAGKTYNVILAPTAKTITDIGSNLGHITLVSPTSGLVNGVNTQFVFTTKPDFIFNDHGLYYTTGWTWNSGTNTVTVSVPPNDELYGGYLY
jgi:hypothetical protein